MTIAKEPNRPLTLNEVLDGVKEGRQLYIEEKLVMSNTGWDKNGMLDYWVNKDLSKYQIRANYGFSWRCWAEKPTDEELAAAKWEEADHG